jgi:diguanylate cyclase (GGDEF)-like protein
MPGSLLSYLVGLTLVPMLGFGVYAGLLVGQAEQQAQGARRLAVGMQKLADVDAMRIALTDESISNLIAVLANTLGVPYATLAATSGVKVATPAASQKESDAALRKLVADPVTAPAARAIWSQRAALLASAPTGKVSLTQATTALNGYVALFDAAGDMESTAGERVSGGGFGRTSTSLSIAAGQVTNISLLTVQGGKRVGAMLGATSAPRSGRAAALTQLRQADASYQGIAAVVTPALRGEIAARWKVIAGSTVAAEVAADVAQVLDGSSGSGGGTATGAGGTVVGLGGIQLDQSALTLYTEQSALLNYALTRGLHTARTERAQALGHARNVVLVAAGLILLTLLGLGLVAVTLRHRLRLLADGARALSSGQFITVDVPGPRELELGGLALNDASRSLERALASAERLAAGDLTADALSAAPEGRLGTAVHAAFQQVTLAIQERERLQHELAHQASHDSLTGLPNRSAAEGLLLTALEQNQVGGAPMALLFVDLDHFKIINDTHGHAAGDHVLQVAAERMKDQARAEDTVCRLGGDEFIVVLRGGHEEAAAVGARIVAAVTEPIGWHGETLRVGASVGIATCETTDTSADELLIRADQAVYRAKAEGRGLVRF